MQPEKFAKKEREVERRRQKLRQRIARMTPEELAVYRLRSEAVKPRSATEREMRRRDRQAAELLAPRPAPAPNPEITRLEAELAAIRVTNGRLKALLNEDISTEGTDDE